VTVRDTVVAVDPVTAGRDMYDLIAELYPICRSITGEGFRSTLDILARHLDLAVHEVASGTRVFDWTVPREWNITDAYVATSAGERVIDFRASNLHVVSYSVPVDARMSLSELRPHLHTLPEHPEWIPYRTSYYDDNWGFCLSQRQFDRLAEDEYHVVIDSSLTDGYLTYGEYLVPRPRRCWSPAMPAIHRYATTICPAWSLRPGSPRRLRIPSPGTATGSSSSQAPSGRSPGSPATRRRSRGSGPGWYSPA
jgi:aminopeptidase-like protein